MKLLVSYQGKNEEVEITNKNQLFYISGTPKPFELIVNQHALVFIHDGKVYESAFLFQNNLEHTFVINGQSLSLSAFDPKEQNPNSANQSANNQKNLKANMPGRVVKIMHKEGDMVSTGQALLVLEAMKMENEMRAQKDVCIEKIHVEEGQAVEGGTLLMSFKDA